MLYTGRSEITQRFPLKCDGVLPWRSYGIRNIIDGLAQDYSISTTNALEIQQPYTKPSIYCYIATMH